ncbi:phasin family protein [Limnobacter humi]|uniref:Phasin family protein n=2 Tax=Limnobacter humi TaxID=1778671 RepID=A0ABT1WGT3_9BURK|nr:phasin family protein [Limnobacter humi]
MMLTPEQIVEVQKANLDKLLGLSLKSFAHVEKAVELNLNTVKIALEDGVEAIKALSAAKDVQDFVAVSSAVAQPLSEKAVAYGKNVYTLASGIASEAAQLVEEQVNEGNKKFVELFEAASKNAPAGSEGAIALVKSAITAANSAYDSVSKATKQAVEMAEANVEAASKATLKAATAAASTAKGRKAA